LAEDTVGAIHNRLLGTFQPKCVRDKCVLQDGRLLLGCFDEELLD